MKLFGKVEVYGRQHHKKWMDVLRIAFGALLLIKGLYYVGHTDYVMRMIQSNFNIKDVEGIVCIVIAFLHIFFGCCIFLGIGTRIVSLILIPVVLLSVPFANYHLIDPLSFLMSVATLFLCVFFFIEGSGKFSVYAYMINQKTSPENMTTPAENEK